MNTPDPALDPRCRILDFDCAPPVRCDLKKSHEGPHQWTIGETTKLFPRPVASANAAEIVPSETH